MIVLCEYWGTVVLGGYKCMLRTMAESAPDAVSMSIRATQIWSPVSVHATPVQLPVAAFRNKRARQQKTNKSPAHHRRFTHLRNAVAAGVRGAGVNAHERAPQARQVVALAGCQLPLHLCRLELVEGRGRGRGCEWCGESRECSRTLHWPVANCYCTC